MAAAIQLDTENRDKLGTRTARHLRLAGKVPAVVYGHNEAVLAVAVPGKLFGESLAKGAHLFELSLGGAKENVLLKDVQFDHLGKDVIHIDFARVNLNERVTVTVPVTLVGESKGEAAGGNVQQVTVDIEIECPVTEIPQSITHNISDLELDAALHVSDLKLPANIVAVTDAETIICVIHLPKAEEEAEDADTAEPEVISKGKDEEGEAEAK